MVQKRGSVLKGHLYPSPSQGWEQNGALFLYCEGRGCSILRIHNHFFAKHTGLRQWFVA